MATKKKTAAKPKTRIVYRSAKKKMTKRRSRRRGLSAASPAAVKSAVMDGVFAAGGAMIAALISNQKFLDNQSDTNKGLILAAAATATAVLVKQPRLAAGMFAVAGLTIAKGVGAGKLVGLAENVPMLPISEDMTAMLPYGLQEGADYAGLSEDIYASNYANRFNGIF